MSNNTTRAIAGLTFIDKENEREWAFLFKEEANDEFTLDYDDSELTMSASEWRQLVELIDGMLKLKYPDTKPQKEIGRGGGSLSF